MTDFTHNEIRLLEPTDTFADDDLTVESLEIQPEDIIRAANEYNQGVSVRETHREVDNSDFPGLPLSESGKLLKKFISLEGFGDHHIEVYDRWIYGSSYNNVYGRMLQFKDDRVVCFENLKVLQPRYTRDGKVLPLTPKMAREQFVTYGSDWHVDVVIRRGSCAGEELARRSSVCIGTIPVMLKSRNCFLHSKSARELALLGEDPKDPGGYFIVEGVEKVVLLQEQLSVNKIFLMNMDSKGTVVARMTANTPSGTALIELAMDKKTKTVMKIRFPSMRNAKQNEKYKSINVLRIFRLFGISDVSQIQDTIALFMKPEHVKKSMLKLTRNIVDFIILPNDINIIADKLAASRNGAKYTEDEKMVEVRKVLDKDLFPHLNNLSGPDGETVQERDIRISQAKIYLLSIMIAKFLEYLAGFRQVDDRDSWSNKRVEGAGRMMEQLFRNAWRKTLGIVQAGIENDAVRDLGSVIEKIKYSVITDTFRDSFITSNWGVKGTQMKSNVAQTLSRESKPATFSHINTVDVGISRTDRNPLIRMVQNSQYGLVCAVQTPEGDNCGILKNLSITTKVSLERPDTDIIRYLLGDRDKGLPSYVAMDLSNRGDWRGNLMVNGKFLGWCDVKIVKDLLVAMRRSGDLFVDMSVIQENEWLYVDIGPSRPTRPLLIVDPDQRLAIDRLGLRDASNHTLLSSGAMEYLSAWEQEYIKLASTTDVIKKRLDNIRDSEDAYRAAVLELEKVKAGEEVLITKIVAAVPLTLEEAEQIRDLAAQKFATDRDEKSEAEYNQAVEYVQDILNGEEVYIDEREEEVPMTLEEANSRLHSAEEALTRARSEKPYTHCEIDPIATLGIAAALIPWPNHNQAPRNTYQCGMGKQALGVYHSNHQNRMNDGTVKILAYPNRALVETELYAPLGLDQQGPGENAVVAFMCLPNTEEDSFIFKQEFLDNGGFRIYKYLTYKTIIKHNSAEITEKLAKPERRPGEPESRYAYIQKGEPDSPINGLPMIGAPLKQGDCVIGKVQYVPATKDFRNESVILRVGDQGVVDKISVSTDNKNTIVVVKLRMMRVPQPGDKFAPRNAQKGTIGEIKPERDMPFNEHGISPDIIVNSLNLPSRMTLEYPMELLASKHAAMRGVHINGSAFEPFELDKYRETLKEYGMNEFGYETYRSGCSGKPLKALISSSLVFFQALKHHVLDKIQARSTGQVKPMTRQPPEGRGVRGGLRWGEMERDAAISYGASALLRSRLMLVSDAYQSIFCKSCGTFGIYDAKTQVYKPCRLCGDSNYGRCVIPYAFKLLIHLLAAPGLNLRPEFISSSEYAAEIFKGAKPLRSNIDDITDILNDADAGLEDQQEEDQIYDDFENTDYGMAFGGDE